MACGMVLTKKQKERCLRKVQHHLPTSSSNKDLCQLSVVGTNVFMSEKAHAMKLIEQVEAEAR